MKDEYDAIHKRIEETKSYIESLGIPEPEEDSEFEISFGTCDPEAFSKTINTAVNTTVNTVLKDAMKVMSSVASIPMGMSASYNTDFGNEGFSGFSDVMDQVGNQIGKTLEYKLSKVEQIGDILEEKLEAMGEKLEQAFEDCDWDGVTLDFDGMNVNIDVDLDTDMDTDVDVDTDAEDIEDSEEDEDDS